MRQKSGPLKEPTGRQGDPLRHSTAVFGGGEDSHRRGRLRGEDSIAELCRREGIVQNSISAGPGNLWRPARSAWPATRSGRPPRTRSSIFVEEPARSDRALH
jgi:hypothetical protein